MKPIMSGHRNMTNYETKLIGNAIRRKKLFLALSIISVITALGLTIYYSWKAYNQPEFDNVALHFVVVILILLNARQNLRQHYYAKVLEEIYDESVALKISS